MAEPTDSSLPPKLYFRIGEVSELVGVEPHVLRYWEREFRIIRPTKSARGQRVYSRRDVENLMRVRELLYKEGFTIAGAKKKLIRPGAAQSEAPQTDAPQSEAPQTDVDGTEAQADPRGAPSDGAAPELAENVVQLREQLHAMRVEIESFLAEIDEPLATKL